MMSSLRDLVGAGDFDPGLKSGAIECRRSATSLFPTLFVFSTHVVGGSECY